jgi:hypothetical protein
MTTHKEEKPPTDPIKPPTDGQPPGHVEPPISHAGPVTPAAEVSTAAGTLLAALRRMPWCFEHRFGCPDLNAGPCLCGAAALRAASADLSTAVGPS